ncbi:hypothetical protein Efla_001637 [Eimeria flavescens]
MESQQPLAEHQHQAVAQASCTADHSEEVQPNAAPNWITSLEEELDKKILVILRDGKKLIGFLRTFDQFGNLMLERCVQRTIVNTYFSDVYLGVMIIRGENILLFGAVDDSKPSPLEARPLWQVLQMNEEQEKLEAQRRRYLRQLGDYTYGHDLPDD